MDFWNAGTGGVEDIQESHDVEETPCEKNLFYV